MNKELKAYLEEVQTIFHDIWEYGHKDNDHKLDCHKIEGMTCIKIRIHSEDLHYLTGGEIEQCVNIANKHQEKCFNTWSIDITQTIVETKNGDTIRVVTPRLIISLYQRQKEESK